MKKRIHINMHVIRRNNTTGERNPVITCKTSKDNTYGHRVRYMETVKLSIHQINHCPVEQECG